MSIEPIARPGDELAVTWDIEDPEELLTKDLHVDCWTEEGWDAAWIVLDVFGTPTALILEPGDDATVRLEGYRSRAGVVVVPDAAPDGSYRANRYPDAAVFEVRTN